MGEIQIHTAQGWINLEDIIQAQERCTTCGVLEGAEGVGYWCIDPILYHCRKCREAVK